MGRFALSKSAIFYALKPHLTKKPKYAARGPLRALKKPGYSKVTGYLSLIEEGVYSMERENDQGWR